MKKEEKIKKLWKGWNIERRKLEELYDEIQIIKQRQSVIRDDISELEENKNERNKI